MSNFVAVPIRVDALFSPGQSILQSLADFRFLPFVDTQPTDTGFRDVARPTSPRDANSEVPYLSESFVAQPFSDQNFWLPTGVHLHWALPDALTIGRHPIENGRADHTRPITFPPIPNRWLVVRNGGSKPTKRWVVESDYLSTSSTTSLQSITYPLRNPPGDLPPFRFLGRVRELDGPYVEDQTAKFLYQYGESLTAVGYGEPTFHAFYPNCHSVLGFYDQEFTAAPLPTDLSYEVYGWYSNPTDDVHGLAHDPLEQSISDFNSDAPPGFSTRDKFVRQLLNVPAGATLTTDDYERAFQKHLNDQFHWQIAASEIPLESNKVVAEGMICYGLLTFDGSESTPSTQLEIAFGNTGTEAVSAFLAQKLSAGDEQKRSQYENQLEALTLTLKLQDQKVDLGPKFEESRHEKTFSAVSGGILWELRPQSPGPSASADRTQLDQGIETWLRSVAELVDQELARHLAELNRLQSAYTRGQDVIRSLRRSIYSDWYKYMLCCYRPTDVQQTTFPEPDWVKRLIEKEVVELYLLQTFVGQVQLLQDTTSKQFAAKLLPLSGDIHFDEIPSESVRVLGSDLLRRLQEGQSSQADKAKELDEQFFFLHSFSDCAKDFLNGGSKIPDALLTLLGNQIYGQDQPDFISRYPVGADGQRSFSPIAAMYVAVMEKLGTFLNLLTLLHQSATQSTVNFADVLAKLESFDKTETIAPFVETLTALLGTITDMGQQAAVVRRVATLLTPWLLQPTTAPRYWTPNEPVILLAGEAVKPSDRYGEDGELPCAVIAQDVRTADATTIATLKSQLTSWKLTNTEVQPFTPRQTSGNPYHALFLEWQAAILPLENESNIAPAQRDYTKDFVRKNYSLKQTRHEFLRRDVLATPTASTSIFSGRSVLTAYANSVLQDLVDHYKTTSLEVLTATEKGSGKDAKHLLDTTYIQTQSLTGFNSALLMGRQTMQLPVADPLAFADYKKFSEVVRDAVGNQNHLAPDPLFDFQPIRNGDMQFQQLRVVDTFGRVFPIDPQQLITPVQMTSFRPWWVSLQARISQPARIQFRWISALSDLIETNSHSLTSPVCGWLVANNLDGSLMIYDASGPALGYIDEMGRWHSTPGQSGPVKPGDIANPHLARMASWICATAASVSDPAQFIRDLLDVVTSALENIEPENFAQYQGQSLLMSRPVVLVRATVDLQLRDPAASHSGWTSFRRRLHGQSARTDQFTEVEFPVRIGEYRQLNDGVVGYWIEQQNGEYEQFVAPQSRWTEDIAAREMQENLLLYPGENGSESDTNFYRSLSDPPTFLSILMDPRGLAHCTTGVLPTKSLSIPTRHYANTLKKLNLSFLTAPLLCEPNAVQVPLPRVPGYGWSWVQHDQTQWTGITTTPAVRRSAVLKAFPDGDAIWDELVARNWLTPTSDPDRAIVTPGSKHLDLDTQFKPRQADIQRLLDLAEEVLQPPPEEARFTTHEIREGWLRLIPE